MHMNENLDGAMRWLKKMEPAELTHGGIAIPYDHIPPKVGLHTVL